MALLTEPPLSSEAALVRALGVRQLTAAVVNATVGAGIFVIPALVSQGLGPAAPLAFLLCAAIMALIVTTLAMAGSRVALTGGIYAYVEVAFGPFAAFLAGVLQWLTGLLAVSSVATAMLDQLAALTPGIEARTAHLVALTLVLATLARLNVRGVRPGARLIEAVTVAKLVPLLVFVGVGIFFVGPATIAWPGLPDREALGRSVLLLIFAYSGVEVAIAPSGEVKDPARTVPRSLFLALGLTTLLYVAIQLVAQGVFGALLSQQTTAPLAAAAGRFLGPAGITLMLLGAICSMFGYLCGDMLSSPRSLYALARDGFLPAPLARIHPAFHTPATAILVHAALVLLFASTNTFQSLAIISNVGLLLLYLLACAAALELSRRDVRIEGRPPFAMPGAWVGPVAGGVLLLWILSTATLAEFSWTAFVLAVATLTYVVRKRFGSAAS
ncbi:MAG: amino acid permease [Acidobacteria bacterium]|nr:amino acid permease [Acidobacteriota bacterium]